MPQVGSAWYELGLKDASLLEALQRDEGKIKHAGAEAEAAFDGKAASGAAALGREVESTGKKAGGFGDTFRGVAQGALMGVGIAAFSAVTNAVGGMANAIIGGASDWNENLSKSQVVFGRFAGEIEQWSKDAPTHLAMTQSAALAAAGTLGNLFVSLKLGEEPAAKMSKSLIELATDLGSFNNVSPEEALDALRSGLIGETEPLRRFGVNLNEATVAQEALNLGLIKSTKEAVTPAIRAQAAYALILDQTKTAQGDFARTSEGFANSTRIANAKLNDELAKLGQRVLPVLVAIMPAVIAGVSTFFDVFGKLLDVAGGAVKIIADVAGAGKGLIDQFLGPALPFTVALSGAMIVLAGPTAIMAVASGIGTIVGTGLGLIDTFQSVISNSKLLTLALEALPFVVIAVAVGELISKLNTIGTIMDEFSSNEIVKTKAGMQTLTDQFGVNEKTVGSLGDAYRALKARLDELQPPAKAAATEVNDLSLSIDDSTGSFDAHTVAMSGNGTAAGAWAAYVGAAQTAAVDGFGNLQNAVTVTGQTFGTELPKAQAVVQTLATNVQEKLAAAGDAFDALNKPVVAAAKKVSEVIRALPGDIASSLEAGQDRWTAAVKFYGKVLENDMTEAAETAKIKAILAGKNLADGLKSKDAEVRAAAQALKAAAEERLFALQWNVPEIALKTGQSYADALAKKEASVRKAAAALGHPLEPGQELPSPAQMETWAKAAAEAYAQGLREKQAAITLAAQTALTGSRNVFRATSPPGPLSPLHEIDIWGANTAAAWVRGLSDVLAAAPAKIAPGLSTVRRQFMDLVTDAAAAVRGLAVASATPTASAWDAAAAAARGDPNAGLPPLPDYGVPDYSPAPDFSYAPAAAANSVTNNYSNVFNIDVGGIHIGSFSGPGSIDDFRHALGRELRLAMRQAPIVGRT